MDPRLTGAGVVPLSAAADESLFGGKAVSLGAAIRAGLPVPTGAALAWRVTRPQVSDHLGSEGLTP